METTNTTQPIPSEREIIELEHRLAEMKKVREEIKQRLLTELRSPDVLNSLSKEDVLLVMRIMQQRIRGVHRKVRGARVPTDMKNDLIQAIIEGSYTLSQMAKMYNVSISYISKIKTKMRAEGKLPPPGVQNVYQDRPLVHHATAA